MLKNGAQLPKIEARDLAGNAVDIGRLSGTQDGLNWTVVLFYRGDW
tara:strand:- start:206 stop:343 length:138 start_codon:yes stop_codon:yes gene_type:complete